MHNNTHSEWENVKIKGWYITKCCIKWVQYCPGIGPLKVSVQSILRTVELCSMEISNHVAHLLLYRPEFKDYVWSNLIKC